MRISIIAALAGAMLAGGLACAPGEAKPIAARPDPPTILHVGGAEITVEIGAGHLDLSRAELIAWISTAASAVTAYFGRFPVDHYRVEVEPDSGASGVLSGTTWGYGGAHTRMVVGEHATAEQLGHDWIMTHEMVHTAFPDQPDEHHWIEEGTATYVEPLARSWVGNYPAARVWSDLVDGLPNGLPHPDDHGLDHTHTWGRTYWGGALFCLLADVEIRQRTGGKRGLVDALRGIVAAGGNDQVAWPIERAFAVGDKAVGVPVLTELYAKLKAAPVSPDLDALWRDLGITMKDGVPVLDDQAPKAAIRRAINTRPADVPSSPTVPQSTGPSAK
jgi:hypothetical protein